MSCYIKVNSNTIELTVHTFCYCILDLLCVNSLNQACILLTLSLDHHKTHWHCHWPLKNIILFYTLEQKQISKAKKNYAICLRKTNTGSNGVFYNWRLNKLFELNCIEFFVTIEYLPNAVYSWWCVQFFRFFLTLHQP